MSVVGQSGGVASAPSRKSEVVELSESGGKEGKGIGKRDKAPKQSPKEWFGEVPRFSGEEAKKPQSAFETTPGKSRMDGNTIRARYTFGKKELTRGQAAGIGIGIGSVLFVIFLIIVTVLTCGIGLLVYFAIKNKSDKVKALKEGAQASLAEGGTGDTSVEDTSVEDTPEDTPVGDTPEDTLAEDVPEDESMQGRRRRRSRRGYY